MHLYILYECFIHFNLKIKFFLKLIIQTIQKMLYRHSLSSRKMPFYEYQKEIRQKYFRNSKIDMNPNLLATYKKNKVNEYYLLTVQKQQMLNSNMRKQNSSNSFLNYQEFYLKYDFSLSDLVEIVPSFRLFSLQTYQIDINCEQNFTFGTQWYTIKIPKRSDNQRRILYYTLLTYMFEICEQSEAQKYQQEFVKYVLKNLQLILPYKGNSQTNSKINSPLMTTNQMKACFMKFVKLLKQRHQTPKLVLQELMTLPQMDFVMMSIIQMYTKKGQFKLENELYKIQKDFGIKSELTSNGFILNSVCQVQVIQSDVKWNRYFIKKIDMKKSKIPSSLRRKETTQSVGEIDEEYMPSQQNINDFLHYEELINVKFAVSYQSQEVQKLQIQALNDKKFDFIQQKQDITTAFTKKCKPQTFGHILQQQIPQRSVRKEKRTSFVNENLLHYNFVKNSKGIAKKQRVKTESAADVMYTSNQINENAFKPWTPKISAKINDLITLNKNKQISKSSKNLEIKRSRCSFQAFSMRCQSRKKTENKQIQQIRFPHQRKTLQKLTFNYGKCHIETC